MIRLGKKLYSMACLTACILTLSGCIDEYEADIPAEDSNLLMVEGTISSGKLCNFRLSRTVPVNSAYPAQMVLGASVSVRGSDGLEYPAQENAGNYACQTGTLDPDATYYLHIETDGEVYESEPQKPLRTEKIADVRGVQNTPESSIDVLVTPDSPADANEVKYYSWTYDETWEVRPDYRTVLYYDVQYLMPKTRPSQFPERGWVDAVGKTVTVGSSATYSGQHIERLKIYDVDRTDVRMYYRYSGLVHQRAISKAEYEYELARRQASSEMGGLFTPLPSALPTNVRCLTSNKRVIGFVGCSLNTSDYRFFLTPQEFSTPPIYIGDTRIWIENPTEADCLRMVQQGLYLCEWIYPIMSEDGQTHVAWAFLHQLDIRARYEGAYIEMPDFWSLEENVSY